MSMVNNAEASITTKDLEAIRQSQKALLKCVNDSIKTASQTALLKVIANETDVQPSGSSQIIELNDTGEDRRTCWICLSNDEENDLDAWVQPCKCRGSTKWVHQRCLLRWVDEKQKGFVKRTVRCHQCLTEYMIICQPMNKIANILEICDNFCHRASPLFAFTIVSYSLYWSALTYGLETLEELVGTKETSVIIMKRNSLLLLTGLPAIPVLLILGRMINWQDAVLHLIRNRRRLLRKLPLTKYILPYPDEEDDYLIEQNFEILSPYNVIMNARSICGALMLPTISAMVGRLLYKSVQSQMCRTLLGGLTFLTVKGALKIYLRQQQYNRQYKRSILRYNAENLHLYGDNRRNNVNANNSGNTNHNNGNVRNNFNANSSGNTNHNNGYGNACRLM